MPYTQRWVWDRGEPVPINNYISKNIISGPLPVIVNVFLKRNDLHTGVKDLMVPIFSSEETADRYHQLITTEATGAQLACASRPLERLLMRSNLPALNFALDIDPTKRPLQEATIIRVCDIGFYLNI